MNTINRICGLVLLLFVVLMGCCFMNKQCESLDLQDESIYRAIELTYILGFEDGYELSASGTIKKPCNQFPLCIKNKEDIMVFLDNTEDKEARCVIDYKLQRFYERECVGRFFDEHFMMWFNEGFLTEEDRVR